MSGMKLQRCGIHLECWCAHTFGNDVWACSLGQALIFTGEAIAVILGGNLASAFKIHNVSWRAAPLGLAVTAFLVAVAIAVLIREPKKGRFIVQVKNIHISIRCMRRGLAGIVLVILPAAGMLIRETLRAHL